MAWLLVVLRLALFAVTVKGLRSIPGSIPLASGRGVKAPRYSGQGAMGAPCEGRVTVMVVRAQGTRPVTVVVMVRAQGTRFVMAMVDRA
jgi:hypothetical protein